MRAVRFSTGIAPLILPEVLLHRFVLENHNGKQLQQLLVIYISAICVVLAVVDQFGLAPIFTSYDGTR